MVHEAAEAFVKGERDDLIPELEKFADEFYAMREEYPDGKTLVEDRWAFDRDWNICDDYFGDDVWTRMSLDWFRWTSPSSADFIDYKTGRDRPIPHAQQRMIYAVGCFMRFPELQVVRGTFWYTDIGPKKSRWHTYTRPMAMKFLPGINDRAIALTDTDTFPAKPNRSNCRYCPWGPSKGDGSCEWGVE